MISQELVRLVEDGEGEIIRIISGYLKLVSGNFHFIFIFAQKLSQNNSDQKIFIFLQLKV